MAPKNQGNDQNTRLNQMEERLRQVELARFVGNVNSTAQYMILLGRDIQREAADAAKNDQLSRKVDQLSRALQAVAFVADQVALFHLKLWHIQNAIEIANIQYKDILTTEGSKELDITGLVSYAILALMPEVGSLGLALKQLDEGTTTQTVRKLQVAVGLVKTGAKLGGAGSFLPKPGDNGGNGAKIQSDVLQQWYDSCLNDMAIVTNMQSDLTKNLINGGLPDPLSWIKQKWQDSKMEILSPVDPQVLKKNGEVLRDALLYEMIHQYIRTYVQLDLLGIDKPPQITRAGLDAFHPGPEGREIHGLNDKQLAKVFQRFATVPWKDVAGRPALNSWRDLALLGAQINFKEGVLGRHHW